MDNSLFRSLSHFEIGLFGILMSSFLSSLYILETDLPSDVGLVKISLSVHCHFVLLIVSSALQKIIRFTRPHLLIVISMSVLQVLYSGSGLQWQCAQGFLFYEFQCDL